MNGRLAVSIDAGRSLPSSVERARVAEGFGYDSIWSSQLPPARDTSLVLAAYACATSSIGLGTAVLPIYLRHPTAMAQMAVTLDELSGGRFRLGIGIGWNAVEYEGLGMDFHNRGRRLTPTRCGLLPRWPAATRSQPGRAQRGGSGRRGGAGRALSDRAARMLRSS